MVKGNNILAFVIAVAAVLTSCDKEGAAAAAREIAFDVTGSTVTKGVVSGTTLYDEEEGYRPMYVTAYLHSQSGADQRYITDEPFVRISSLWRHNPSLYWPISGTMDFLAYSVSEPFRNGDIIWGSENSAERMRIHVGADRTQDDILYGASWHSDSQSYSYTGITMFHSQALIEVSAVLKSGSLPLPVTVEKAVIRDVYLTGYLNIENNYGHPVHEWDFRAAERRDRVVEDPRSVYGTEIPYVTPKTLSMLIPEQPMTALEIYYTVDGVSDSVTYDLEHTHWVAGRKYTYSLIFDPVSRASSDGMYKARVVLEEGDF